MADDCRVQIHPASWNNEVAKQVENVRMSAAGEMTLARPELRPAMLSDRSSMQQIAKRGAADVSGDSGIAVAATMRDSSGHFGHAGGDKETACTPRSECVGSEIESNINDEVTAILEGADIAVGDSITVSIDLTNLATCVARLADAVVVATSGPPRRPSQTQPVR